MKGKECDATSHEYLSQPGSNGVTIFSSFHNFVARGGGTVPLSKQSNKRMV